MITQGMEQRLLVPEERIIAPLVEVLENVTPKLENIPKLDEPIKPSLHQSLNELFPEQQYEEKDVQKAKEMLGELANCFTSEQLKDVVSETKYLVETLLDDFEREIFSGKTLQELLHEKSNL